MCGSSSSKTLRGTGAGKHPKSVVVTLFINAVNFALQHSCQSIHHSLCLRQREERFMAKDQSKAQGNTAEESSHAEAAENARQAAESVSAEAGSDEGNFTTAELTAEVIAAEVAVSEEAAFAEESAFSAEAASAEQALGSEEQAFAGEENAFGEEQAFAASASEEQAFGSEETAFGEEQAFGSEETAFAEEQAFGSEEQA